MFSHIMIGTNDLDKAKSFYDALLGTLGVKPGFVDRHRIFWRRFLSKANASPGSIWPTGSSRRRIHSPRAPL